MSLTIQDCASMSAAERRERRRQKILHNAEGRISAILAGPDGTEKRMAPTLEGLYGEEETKKLGSEHGGKSNAASDDLGQDSISYVLPVYYELVNRSRIGVMLFLGVVLRLAVQFGVVERAALTFLALFAVYQAIFELPQRMRRKYPKHGYLVNTLLVFGLNERAVVWIGLVIDFGWELVTDTCIWALAFLGTHLALVLGQIIRDLWQQ